MKRLSLLLIATLIASSLSTYPVIAQYEPPSSLPPIWLWANDYNVTTENYLTGTRFNITVSIHDVGGKDPQGRGMNEGLGSIEFKLWYNTTLLNAVYTYLTPMSTAYLSDYGPLDPETMMYTPTSPINDTLGRIYWFAVVKTLANPFIGSAPVLIITFEIAMAPPRGYAPPEYITYGCDLHFNETELWYIYPAYPFPTGKYVLDTDYSLDDGFYQYRRPQIIPPIPVADFTFSPAIPREGDTITLRDTSLPGEGAYIMSWKWIIQNITGEAALTGPDDASVTTMQAVKAGTVTVSLNVTNNLGSSDIETKTLEILMTIPVADFTFSPAIPREGDTITLRDTSLPGEGAYIMSWKWIIQNITGEAALTGPDDASVTTMQAVKAGTVTVSLNVTNNFGNSDVETKTIKICMRTTLFVHPQESMVVVSKTFKIGVIVDNVVDLNSFEFKLSYNTTILDVINVWVMWPDFYVINETAGIVWIGASCPYPYPFSGSGPLAVITLKAMELGSCVLDLHNTTLIDFYSTPIAHETVDSYVVTIIRDIAVVNVAPSTTEAYPGWNISVIVTVKNQGSLLSETFWVAVYYYDPMAIEWIIIGNQTITDLAAGAQKLVTFRWNTRDMSSIIVNHNYGAYRLKATASILPSEVDTSNNVLVAGEVRLRLIGDVNGDTVVSAADMLALKIAISLEKTVAEEPFCDLNFNNVVSVADMLALKIILTRLQ